MGGSCLWRSVLYWQDNFHRLPCARLHGESYVTFLTKSKAGDKTYKWPKRKDTDQVSAAFIFYSSPSLEMVDNNFVLSNNRPFAASHSRGTKPPYWRAKVGLGQDKQKACIILNGNFLCLPCPSATFAFQYGGFVPSDWRAARAY